MRWIWAASLVLLAVSARAEQAGDSGKSLAQFCNTVPDLSTLRSDSVDNWVKICTVWFNAACRAPEAKPVKDDARAKDGGEKKH